MAKKKKFQAKSKDMIDEALDIVINTEEDEFAVTFLRDTLNDDYPDLDLGRMDLHEAIKELGMQSNKEKSGSRKAIENLNKSLGEFLDKNEKKLNDVKKKRKSKRKKTAKKKK